MARIDGGGVGVQWQGDAEPVCDASSPPESGAADAANSVGPYVAADVQRALASVSEPEGGELPGAGLSGGIGGLHWGVLRPDAKCAVEMDKFYQDISKTVADFQGRARPKIDELNLAREQLNARATALEEQAKALQMPEDRGARASWQKQREALTGDAKEMRAQRNELGRQLQELQSTPLKVGQIEFPAKAVGPVGAVVVDGLTGRSFSGINSPDLKTLPADLHPMLEERLRTLDVSAAHGSAPGTHAEVHALNDAIWAREEWNGGRQRGERKPTKPITVLEQDLSSFSLDTAWLDSSKKGGMVAGESAPRCHNCRQTTDGVRNLAGDAATAPYAQPAEAAPAAPSSTLQKLPMAEATVDAMKGGTKVGLAVGVVLAAHEAIRDGTFDVKKFGRTVVTSTGAGAMAGGIEEVTARAIDRRAGQLIERGAETVAKRAVGSEVASGVATAARGAAGRLAGAGVAGAVVNAGFSAVDQVGAYERGEVSGSQAIGTVVGETAIGAGAGLAGAAAGAALGSVVPGIGNLVGAVVGFGVGYWADKRLRQAGVDQVIARGVSSAIDGATR